MHENYAGPIAAGAFRFTDEHFDFLDFPSGWLFRVDGDVALTHLIVALLGDGLAGRVVEGDRSIGRQCFDGLSGRFVIPRGRGQIRDGNQNTQQNNEDGQAYHQPSAARPCPRRASGLKLTFLM